jgi:hypothetical protein
VPSFNELHVEKKIQFRIITTSKNLKGENRVSMNFKLQTLPDLSPQ